jgi:stearoyl-CoA desaturase (delta-9 desaturase)
MVIESRDSVAWSASLPFFALHAACLPVLWVGAVPVELAVALGAYLARMFAITGGYHRYFAHASYRTSRTFQFALAWLGAASAQKGPLWWAGHHRNHHLYSDTEKDIHSPVRGGLWWSHVGWILSTRFDRAPLESIKEFARYPELRFLDRYHWLVPVSLATVLFAAGAALARWAPSLGTNGPRLLLWGFVVSTVVLYHATFSINSLAHRWGSRRYATSDDSRNNPWLALITLGEGWHNNHHRAQYSERQGFFWWEIDVTHYALKALSWFGVVWDLRAPERAVLESVKADA